MDNENINRNVTEPSKNPKEKSTEDKGGFKIKSSSETFKKIFDNYKKKKMQVSERKTEKQIMFGMIEKVRYKVEKQEKESDYLFRELKNNIKLNNEVLMLYGKVSKNKMKELKDLKFRSKIKKNDFFSPKEIKKFNNFYKTESHYNKTENNNEIRGVNINKIKYTQLPEIFKGKKKNKKYKFFFSPKNMGRGGINYYTSTENMGRSGFGDNNTLNTNANSNSGSNFNTNYNIERGSFNSRNNKIKNETVQNNNQNKKIILDMKKNNDKVPLNNNLFKNKKTINKMCINSNSEGNFVLYEDNNSTQNTNNRSTPPKKTKITKRNKKNSQGSFEPIIIKDEINDFPLSKAIKTGRGFNTFSGEFLGESKNLSNYTFPAKKLNKKIPEFLTQRPQYLKKIELIKNHTVDKAKKFQTYFSTNDYGCNFSREQYRYLNKKFFDA